MTDKTRPAEVAGTVRPVFGLRDLEAALVRHCVIHADAIDDAEGYDEGQTRDAILSVFEDITGMTPNAPG
jgi:hypothetical protein